MRENEMISFQRLEPAPAAKPVREWGSFAAGAKAGEEVALKPPKEIG